MHKKIFLSIEFFLLSIVLILIGVLVVIFTQSDPEPVESVLVETPDVYCGITIVSPKSDEVVTLPLKFSGYISGCGWLPYLDYAVRFKVYDKDMNLISRPYLVRAVEDPSPVSTQFSFTLDTLPLKDGPFNIIFESMSDSAQKVSLPLIFQST